MRRIPSLTFVALGALLAARAAPVRAVDPGIPFGNGARTYLVVGGHARPMLFLCDAVDRSAVLLLSLPAADRHAEFVRIAKPGLAETQRAVVVGEGDPGAGQIFYPLADAAGTQIGSLHAVNPGVFDQPVTTAALVEVTVDGVAASCRFEPQIRFLGATEKRTIMVTGPAAGPYRYQSFDYASPVVSLPSAAGARTKPTLSLSGGHAGAIPGGRRFTFATGSYVYRIDAGTTGAKLTVLHHNHVALANRFTAYTLAAASP